MQTMVKNLSQIINDIYKLIRKKIQSNRKMSKSKSQEAIRQPINFSIKNKPKQKINKTETWMPCG